MSTGLPSPPSLFQRLRDQAAMNYLVMAMAGLLVYAMIQLGHDNMTAAVVAILLAIPGILARWTASPVLILLLTIFVAIDPGFYGVINLATDGSWYNPMRTSGFTVDQLLLAAALLAYFVGHFRLTSIVFQSMPEDPTIRHDADPSRPPRLPSELIGPAEMPRTLAVAAGCAIVGPLMWAAVVAIERIERPNDSDLSLGGSRFVLVTWLLGLALLIASAALVYMRSARMTRAEGVCRCATSSSTRIGARRIDCCAGDDGSRSGWRSDAGARESEATMFWVREVAGWALLVLGLWLFYVSYFGFLRHGAIVESGPTVIMGIVVFRGAIHLLKVAVAARVSQQPLGEVRPPSRPDALGSRRRAPVVPGRR